MRRWETCRILRFQAFRMLGVAQEIAGTSRDQLLISFDGAQPRRCMIRSCKAALVANIPVPSLSVSHCNGRRGRATCRKKLDSPRETHPGVVTPPSGRKSLQSRYDAPETSAERAGDAPPRPQARSVRGRGGASRAGSARVSDVP